jgi:hypothetical protein
MMGWLWRAGPSQMRRTRSECRCRFCASIGRGMLWILPVVPLSEAKACTSNAGRGGEYSEERSWAGTRSRGQLIRGGVSDKPHLLTRSLGDDILNVKAALVAFRRRRSFRLRIFDSTGLGEAQPRRCSEPLAGG